MRTALVAALVIALGSSRARAQAQPAPVPAPSGSASAADAKIASAKDHYAKAELGAALADLAEAYHLDPRPDLLYAMAQIEVELGDCAGAVAHYKQYLGTNPSQKARDAAEKSKAACEAKLGMKPEDTSPHPPPPPPPAPVKRVEPVQRPFYKDALGDSLFAAGLVGGLVGGGLYLAARKDIDDSETAPTLQAHEDLVAKAHDLRTYAVIAGGVGGALAVGAIVRWATHGGGTEQPGVEMTLAPSPDGTGWGIAASGRF
jgi:tetratricopeptide (TPR) repeat protein